MPRSMLVLLGVALMASSPDAQRLGQRRQDNPVLVSTGQRLEVRGAPVYMELDLDSGEAKTLANAGARSSAAACFDNSIDDDPWADALLYPRGTELLDWGVKRCSGSKFVDRIEIGYASLSNPVSMGGPGASVTIRVYANSTGFGNFGQLFKELKLTGLPALGLEPNGSGFLIPSYLSIDLGVESFFLPDGPIGWSYQNTDGFTAPLLVDVDASLGTQNAFDVYSPGPASGASFQGAFLLPPGGASNDPKENSFYLRIHQNDVTATAVSVPAGTNPNILRATVPIVGSTWYASIDSRSVGGTGVTFLAVSMTRQTGVQTPIGELIVDPSTLLTEVSFGVVDAHRHQIALDSSLLGTVFYAQGGFVAAGGLHLTNGMELTIGSF